jgi:hypothetical protein
MVILVKKKDIGIEMKYTCNTGSVSQNRAGIKGASYSTSKTHLSCIEMQNKKTFRSTSEQRGGEADHRG